MERKNKILIIISYWFNFNKYSFSILVEYKIKNFILNNEEDSQLQYEYLTEIWIISFFKLLITTCIFDIGYFLVNLFFNYCFSKFEGNKCSNLVIEFLFFFLIKGIVLGFSYFYSFEINWRNKKNN